MPISRITDTDDSGTGTNGTIHNNAWLQSIYDSIENAFTWTAVAFSAGNFTGSGSQTWTVASGDQTTFQYMKIGKTMTIRFCLETTSVGGTPSTDLIIATPGGYASQEQTVNPIQVINNGVGVSGYAQINAGASSIRCILATAANWAAATNTTSVLGEIQFETVT